MSRLRRFAIPAALAAALAVPASAPAAKYREPALTVPTVTLAAAMHCYGELKGAAKQPLMLVTGTGATGQEAYAIGRPAFEAWGAPVCVMDFPDYTTADIQTSVQYLVYGIRQEAKLAGRPIAVFGISQGGLLPRVALTYWPSLRSKVTDVLAAAGTHHGTTVGASGACSPARPCIPAGFQQRAGSKFLKALNAQRDETPGPTAWTTVRSSGDETVQPQTGRHPTSALDGATNILIQSVCPGRAVTHIGTALDSVTFAAFVDALGHKGPAKLSRLPKNICATPYAPGLDVTTTSALIGAAGNLTSSRNGSLAPTVGAEPAVRAWMKRRVP